MFRLLGYICNDATLNATFFEQGLVDLELDEVDVRGGLGLGWVQDGRSLLRTTPRPNDAKARLGAMLGDIPARSLVAHHRSSDADPVDTLDLQPFRYRRWVFAHAGEVPASDELREALVEPVPEFISGNIKGESGEEVMFHRFLTALHRNGQLGNGQVDARLCADALASAARSAHEQALATYAGVGVSERLLVFASVGVPMWYREVRGLREDRDKPLFAGHRPKPVEHSSFKALLVVQADESPGEAWTAVPDGQVGWVGRDWELRFRPIDDQ
jgi:glutamine amidotransferase